MRLQSCPILILSQEKLKIVVVAWATTIKFLKLSHSHWPVIDFRSGQ